MELLYEILVALIVLDVIGMIFVAVLDFSNNFDGLILIKIFWIMAFVLLVLAFILMLVMCKLDKVIWKEVSSSSSQMICFLR